MISERLTTPMPPKLIEYVRTEAAENGESIGAVIRRALWDYFHKHQDNQRCPHFMELGGAA